MPSFTRMNVERCTALVRRHQQTIGYAAVEPALRSGDIVFYNYRGAPQNVQTSAAPVEKRIELASLISHLCTLLPCLACAIDDRTDAEPESIVACSPRGGEQPPANEVDAAEQCMEQTWTAWQHATLVVVLPDETDETNRERDAHKTLPYVFVPTDKHRLGVLPLRSLLAQSRTECFGLRHLRISDAEALPVCSGPLSPTAAPTPPLLGASASTISPAGAKTLAWATRNIVHGAIIDLYRDIYTHQPPDTAELARQSQVCALLLAEPAPVAFDAQTGQFSLRSRAVTASHAYLADIARRSEQKETVGELKTPAATTKTAPLTQLMPLFLASPAYLALFALYSARVSLLVPRSGHGAAHLRDNGVIDRFLAGGFSLSDEVGVRFTPHKN